ncbi:unnamed protein product [Cylicocyclus nassatus]|uniref:Uncharacterized protein n=1 Tax=Cylicocyclus nassatus TaxID=53992 RepID=A0AA36M6V8_CYLNA|nr:unnamed protein product [Cylicocyclus nassatus]
MTYCTLLILVATAVFSCAAPKEETKCWPGSRFPRNWIYPFALAIKHRCNLPVKLQYHCYMQNDADRYAKMMKKADYLELNMWAIVHNFEPKTQNLDYLVTRTVKIWAGWKDRELCKAINASNLTHFGCSQHWYRYGTILSPLVKQYKYFLVCAFSNLFPVSQYIDFGETPKVMIFDKTSSKLFPER